MSTTMMTMKAKLLTEAEEDFIVYTKTRTTAARIALTYAQQREQLFRRSAPSEDPSSPATTLALDNSKRFHIYVKPGVGPEHKQSTASTLEEARAFIMNEREETDGAPPSAEYVAVWGDYAKYFGWVVKDTMLGVTYTYNPSTRSLERFSA